MLNQYNFRKAKVEDIEELFPFFKKSIRNYFPEYSVRIRNYFINIEYSLNYLKEAVKKERLTIYLSFFEKEIVGYLMISGLVGGICLGNWLAVSKDHQDKGIASRLLEEWEKGAKKEGFHKLHLWADKRNVEFYKKRGFTLVGDIPNNFYGADDYLFYKSIREPEEDNFLK